MSPRRRTPVLVGRRSELAVLEDGLADVRDGRGAVVLVSGEAGLGKSRLVEEFVAAHDDVLAISGGCVDATTDALPYAPWTELLWWLVRELDADALGPARAHLARLLPELGTPADDGNDGTDGKSMLFEAIVEALHSVTRDRDRRVVCVVEDVHWIDAASRDVLLYVVRNMRRMPILLVVTHRPVVPRTELERLVGQLERLGAECVQLRPLSDDDAAGIASMLTGHAIGTPEVERVVQRAEGNPLFVEELVALHGDEGLPTSVRHLMLSRFRAMSDGAQHLVRTAAVIGARPPRALLAAAAPSAGDATREAIEAGVLVADTDGTAYTFAHSLLREAVLDDLLPDEHVALHADVARALATTAVVGPEFDVVTELARHWDAAHVSAEALRATIAAARQAASRYAYDSAIAWFERALLWWDAADDAVSIAACSHSDLFFDAADAAGAAGLLDRAAVLAEQAITVATEPEAAVAAFTRARPHLWAVGRSDELRVLSQSALAYAESVEVAVRAGFLVDLGFFMMFDSRPLDALALAPPMLAAVDEVDEPALTARAHLMLGLSYELTAEAELATEAFATATEAARRSGQWDLLALIVYNHASFLSSATRRAECFERLDEVERLVEERGVRRLLIAARVLRSDELTWAGALDDSARVLDSVADVAMEGVERHSYAYSRALGALHRGAYDEVTELVDVANFPVDRGDDPARIISHAYVRAEALAWQRRMDDAVDVITKALDLMKGRLEPYWLGFLLMAGARVAADQTAGDLRDRVGDALDDMCARMRGSFPLTAAQRAAVAAEIGTDKRVAPQLAHDAANAFDALAMPYYAAYFTWRQAQACLDVNDRREASALLTAARRRAAEHGYLGLERAIEQTARTAQVHLGARSDAPEELLSGREVEVLRLLADGLSNPDIAEALIIGRRTVRAHVSHILEKLGAASRTEAVSIAHRKGII